jgi:hypothetical protein
MIAWALVAFHCLTVGVSCDTRMVGIYRSEQACNAAMVAADPKQMPEEWANKHVNIASCAKVVMR